MFHDAYLSESAILARLVPGNFDKAQENESSDGRSRTRSNHAQIGDTYLLKVSILNENVSRSQTNCSNDKSSGGISAVAAVGLVVTETQGEERIEEEARGDGGRQKALLLSNIWLGVFCFPSMEPKNRQYDQVRLGERQNT